MLKADSTFQGRSAGVPPVGESSSNVQYRDIAWWAETADGTRNEDLVLVEVEENGKVSYIVETAAKAKSDNHKVVIKGIRIAAACPERPKVTNVLVDVNGMRRECKIDGVVCDAVFCTESAVEKFLFPYYHSQRLFTPAEWADLLAAYYSKDVPAIGHVPPSRSGPVGTGLRADQLIRVLKAEVDEKGQAQSLDWFSAGEYRSRFIR